jgi:hypothetical protein
MGGTFSDRYDEEAAGDFSDPSLRETEPAEEIPECTCGSPFLMSHAIWCKQWKYWYF